MKEISGRYPGGPSRKYPPEKEGRPREKVHLPSVSEIESRVSAGKLRRNAEARRKRVAKGVVVFMAVAGVIGLWLGFESHRTEEEIAQREREEATPAPVLDLNMQADRLINEIWKTEALEKIPNRR